MKHRIFWIALYGWAFTYHGLLWIHVYLNLSNVDLAIVSMALGLLFIWGTLFAIFQKYIMNKFEPKKVTFTKFFLVIMLGFIGLALTAEIVSTLMTNTAYLWSLSPYDAYITASPNYIEVVTKHSVIVFIPQFIAIAILHYRYQFKAFQWFIIYGLIGYINEWLAFGASASMVSIPFWMIIYGWIVYLPTYIILPSKERLPFKTYHYIMAIIFPLVLSIPWALLIIEWFHT